MAAYDLQEQEQIDELKTWWKMHGDRVTAVVTVIALAVLAWQGWNWWQRNQTAQAAAIYGGVQAAVAQNDIKRARELAGQLIDQYPSTAYAGLAALLSARMQADGSDTKSAQAQYGWAAEHAKDPAVRDLARLRVAALLFDEKQHDAALARLAAEPSPAFVPRFNELRGDILADRGKIAEARDAYQAALTKLDGLAADGVAGARTHAAYREVLVAKLDGTGK